MPTTRCFLAALLVATAGCSDADAPAEAPTPTETPAAAAPPESTDTVLGVAAAAADLSTFVDLARAAGVDAALRDTAHTLTVFAPSNAAFGALGDDALAALRDDPAALRALLLGHALPYRLFAGDVFDAQTTETLGGTEIALTPGDPLRLGAGGASAAVVTPDLDAGNGVVHVVDAVLAP